LTPVNRRPSTVVVGLSGAFLGSLVGVLVGTGLARVVGGVGLRVVGVGAATRLDRLTALRLGGGGDVAFGLGDAGDGLAVVALGAGDVGVGGVAFDTGLGIRDVLIFRLLGVVASGLDRLTALRLGGGGDVAFGLGDAGDGLAVVALGAGDVGVGDVALDVVLDVVGANTPGPAATSPPTPRLASAAAATSAPRRRMPRGDTSAGAASYASTIAVTSSA
jgi:hypothetical protein